MPSRGGNNDGQSTGLSAPGGVSIDAALTDHAGGISRDDASAWHILRDHRTGADHGLFADLDAGQQEGAGGDEGVGTDCYRGGLHRDVRLGKVVGAGAEEGLDRHGCVRTDFYRCERVDDGAFSDAGTVLERKVAREIDARAAVDKRSPLYAGTEEFQDEDAPGVERLWRPTAEERPCREPECAPGSVLPRPWR